MKSIEDFTAGFDEEPGYLNFAAIGPLGRAVVEEEQAQAELLHRARFGSLDSLERQDERVRAAIASVTGFRPDQVSFQPNTSTGLMHAMFGITGSVLLSMAEFPSLTFAADRAASSLGVLKPVWLETDYGQVTPAAVKEQLDSSITAVAVSLVDFRTGYLADIEGIRQVIGDRLLIVDAIQGFGVVDAPFQVADVVVSGGQKWTRAGWSTGFLALSDRAADALTPVMTGWMAEDDLPLDELRPVRKGASAFRVSNPSPIAQARFSAALEDIASVGVAQIGQAVLERAGRMITIADEYGVPVVSSRADNERAGIVVLEPPADQLTVLTASLYNRGVTATTRQGRVRLSAHATTTDETLDMLRASLLSYSSAVGA
ncbi:aminotransferase class V-fold PLP-dependent enzyme [Parafrigoribacterium humi]|uniref:aminotransferase class V-fold PLP-dependent enzyme n=1 Tax=Parafrigoribacterium humi TaxID=3144664 RepID=UPI0032EBADD4